MFRPGRCGLAWVRLAPAEEGPVESKLLELEMLALMLAEIASSMSSGLRISIVLVGSHSVRQ